MKQEEELRQLDDLIQSRSILNHPFYQAWQRGTLSLTQLATYAKTYYPHVAAFPGYLQSAINGANDPLIRSELEDNLADELSNPAPHHELWKDFGCGVGLKRESFGGEPVTDSTRRTVEVFSKLAARETVGALAALYAYESQQPSVSKTKMEGLQKFYGVTDKRALAYFEVHAEKDIEHSAGERKAMRQCLNNGASSQTVLDAAKQALDAYWDLLDGVCEKAGIDVVC